MRIMANHALQTWAVISIVLLMPALTPHAQEPAKPQPLTRCRIVDWQRLPDGDFQITPTLSDTHLQIPASMAINDPGSASGRGGMCFSPNKSPELDLTLLREEK
jgi:hypothetical protein